MSLATSMKSLVGDIQTSTKERKAFVRGTADYTRELLSRFDRESKETARELGEKAKELRSFLASSEKTRRTNFTTFSKHLKTSLDNLFSRNRALLREYNADRSGAHKIWRSPKHSTPEAKPKTRTSKR